MYYSIEQVKKTEPFGEIIESFRRAGTPAGKAQAFASARQMGKLYPDDTIIVSEVITRDEVNVIGLFNPNDELQEKYKEATILSVKKTPLQRLFLKTIKEMVAQGTTEEEARFLLIDQLQNYTKR